MSVCLAHSAHGGRRASHRCVQTSPNSSVRQLSRTVQPCSTAPSSKSEQPDLGGRVDAVRDPATQPQPSFPSTSVSFTASSLQASDSRAISAFAASSS